MAISGNDPSVVDSINMVTNSSLFLPMRGRLSFSTFESGVALIMLTIRMWAEVIVSDFLRNPCPQTLSLGFLGVFALGRPAIM